MSETVSIHSILIAGAIIFFAVRYFFFTPSTSANGRRSGSSFPGARQVDITKVDQVSQMFPQLDRRAIAWDLSRNSGNVSATTERVLGGQGLDTPPPSFHPPNLSPPPSSSLATARTSSATTPQNSQNLITRYNLSSKLKSLEDDTVSAETPTIPNVWGATKGERAMIYAKRREEMILNARKNMEDAARREAKGKGKAVD